MERLQTKNELKLFDIETAKAHAYCTIPVKRHGTCLEADGLSCGAEDGNHGKTENRGYGVNPAFHRDKQLISVLRLFDIHE